MLYNCGRIFFILSFFVGYILSFGLVRLRTIQLSGTCRCIHWVQVFTLAHGGCDNHRCHNNNPRWEIGMGCEWRHARKWCTGILGDFEKKAVSWDSDLGEVSWVLVYGIRHVFVGFVSWDLMLDEASWFLSLGEASPVGSTGCAMSLLGQWVEILTLGREFSWGGLKNVVETVSIVKILSLSLLIPKN